MFGAVSYLRQHSALQKAGMLENRSIAKYFTPMSVSILFFNLDSEE